MNTKQTNKLNMAKTLKQFFAVEQPKYAGNAPLTARVTELNSILANIDEIADLQTTDTTADTGLKTNARNLMISLTVAYANTAADYFDDKDSPLAKQLTASKSKIKRLSGVESKIYCQKLYNLVDEHKTALKPDYITTAELQDWKEAIDNFDDKAYDAGVNIDAAENATGDLEDEFAKLGTCLSKIDRLMKKYDILNPSFYGNYKISRKTSDLGSRHQKEPQPKP